MADLKDKKEKPKGWEFDFVEGLVVILFLLSLIGYIAPSVLNFSSFFGNLSFFGFKFSNISDFFKNNLNIFKTLGFSLGGLFALGTAFFNIKGNSIWALEKAKMYPSADEGAIISSGVVEPNPSLDKWKQIVEHAESDIPSNWRLAIIEADIMLDDLLFQLHLPGDTMGEKLKAVEKSDFNTIENAWEAHKTRNMIAHEGSDFLLSKRETLRIISLYESVFKEFHMI